MKKLVLAHVKWFCILIASGVLLLYLVSFIPQDLLYDNLHDGRDDYYAQMFPLFVLDKQDDYATYIDVNMDHIMMEISYMLGAKGNNVLNPLVFSYELERNVRYGRYYHGYAVIMRLLMVFMNQAGIKLCLGIAAVLLLLALFCSYIYKKQYVLAVVLLIGAYVTHFDIVCKCTEYVFCAILGLILSIYVCYAKSFLGMKRYLFYFMAGIAVAYFDFLTFETFTLALPLITDIVVHDDFDFKGYVISCIEWGMGYGLAFALKMILLFFNTSEEDMHYSMMKLGDKFSVGGFSLWEGVLSNVELVRFFNSMWLWVCLWIVCLIVIYVVGIDRKANVYIFLTGFVPFARLVCLNGHAIAHCVFTYHALMISVMTVLFVLLSPVQYFVIDRHSHGGLRNGKCKAKI